MKILFLTASTGGGHVKAAQALMEYMEKQLPDCSTILVDALKYINPVVNRLITGTYLNIIRSAPFVYGRFYDLSEKDETITDMVKGLNSILSRRLLRLFENDPPDAVICTHTMPLQMISHLKKRRLLSIPVLGIVTDYTNHFFWKLEEIDAFIVAHEYIKEDMIRMGMRRESIHACGIPVSEHFTANTGDRILLLKKFGLEDKPTILIMGGSLGFGDMQSIFSSLLAVQRDIQIIAVTGYNERLKVQLEELVQVYEENADISGKNYAGRDRKVIILGYTPLISELMSAASLIITKPGGITISEALVKKLPIFIMTPIPGQEERNARFLSKLGAAYRLPQHDSMDAILKTALDRPLMLKRMSEAAARLARPNACEDIAHLLMQLVNSQPEAYYINHSYH